MSTNPIDAAHAAVDLRPRWLRQYARIMRSRSTALAMTRGRKNAFVSLALTSSVSAPPSRATTLPHSWAKSDSGVIPLGNHNQSRRASAILAPMREGGDPYAAARRFGPAVDNESFRWLWVPAFAGTTTGNASPIFHTFFRGEERRLVQWRRKPKVIPC